MFLWIRWRLFDLWVSPILNFLMQICSVYLVLHIVYVVNWFKIHSFFSYPIVNEFGSNHLLKNRIRMQWILLGLWENYFIIFSTSSNITFCQIHKCIYSTSFLLLTARRGSHTVHLKYKNTCNLGKLYWWPHIKNQNFFKTFHKQWYQRSLRSCNDSCTRLILLILYYIA